MKTILLQGIDIEEFKQIITEIVRAENEAFKPPTKRLYSVKALTLEIEVSEQSIRSWIAQGKVKAKKMGRLVFVDLDEFINGLEDVKSLKYKR